MSNTLLGFGLFALVAAIVGGGLKAFGFEVGVLQSTRRQILLAALGIVLVGAAKWDMIESLLHPLVTETDGPTTLEPGETHSIPLSLSRAGLVDVLIQNVSPNWNGFSGQKTLPGPPGLFVRICSSENGGPCPYRQMGMSQAFSQVLPVGSATISVFNFGTSPRVTVTLRIKHPA